MSKRIKKPAVKPEMRKQWLRRFEEDGQSPPQIAKADFYDVRTVRKQIELSRQEREAREARSMVLRQALERHYGDLVSYAEKLDAEIVHFSLPLGAKSDRLWSALREHLPRSALWKAIDRMEQLNDEVRNIEKRAEQRLQDEVDKGSPLGFAHKRDESGLRPGGLAGAMSYHLRAKEGFQLLEFHTQAVEEGLSEVAYGSWNCAFAPDDQISEVKRFILALMGEINQWPEYENIRRRLAERQRVIDAIREELATIILRRVVPGRCKYCPI